MDIRLFTQINNTNHATTQPQQVVPKVLEAEQREMDEMRALIDGGPCDIICSLF